MWNNKFTYKWQEICLIFRSLPHFSSIWWILSWRNLLEKFGKLDVEEDLTSSNARFWSNEKSRD